MADKIEDGGPAFPSLLDEGAKYVEGMSLRDWFAGQALASAWNAFDKGYFESDDPANDIAKAAYQQADAMLKARNA